MQIEVKGRGVVISDEVREKVLRRFDKIGRQVPDAATLSVELREERLGGEPDIYRCDVALALKGVTLRASDRSRDLDHAVHITADELAVQVRRRQEKQRQRRPAGGDAQVA